MSPLLILSFPLSFLAPSLVLLFSPASIFDVSADDGTGMERVGEEWDGLGSEGNVMPAQQEEDERLKLLQAPSTAENIEIGYAKTAKKIDIKALKEDIWEDLQDKRGLFSTPPPTPRPPPSLSSFRPPVPSHSGLSRHRMLQEAPLLR